MRQLLLRFGLSFEARSPNHKPSGQKRGGKCGELSSEKRFFKLNTNTTRKPLNSAFIQITQTYRVGFPTNSARLDSSKSIAVRAAFWAAMFTATKWRQTCELI